ncbi:uncharacterized protein LOC133343196 [Lethenteron reissneri]|uniref:uncharacterized protein LOC133343196 n=1 Tax=Lethenteron reissneri TaxID=7753 RepID=UPI002AB7D82C|nr:uncharacterized protein LOC133343196 [Lethenteron reissneri]
MTLPFFTRQDGLCFCHNVTSLFEAIGIAYNRNEWRLFTDSSSRSLKAVLLHTGNKYLSLPLAHSVHLKEDYNSIKTLLDALKDTKAHYHRRDWPQWTEFSAGRNNVKWEPLVDPRKLVARSAPSEITACFFPVWPLNSPPSKRLRCSPAIIRSLAFAGGKASSRKPLSSRCLYQLLPHLLLARLAACGVKEVQHTCIIYAGQTFGEKCEYDHTLPKSV